jgi:PAS domain S-box-containing protein
MSDRIRSDDEWAGSDGAGNTAVHLVEGLEFHAIFMLDADGAITSWPTPAAALYGYDETTVIDSQVSVLLANDQEDEAVEDIDAVLGEARKQTVSVEGWHKRADGSVFWGTLTLSPLGTDPLQGYGAVCQDTTTAKEYQRMLERQNDRLKEFTDILAHDLRNPLNAIDQYLTLYEATGEEKHIESIDETTDRMSRLVEDLLRVARQGDVVEEPAPTDIETVVDKAWTGTGGSDASLQYNPVPTVSADSDRLVELFENLFRNAVEHGGDGVTVGPIEDGFYVEDDGPGVPGPLGDEVFDHGVTTARDGSGYGLSIVRTIVNAHGWDISLAEEDSGGARFEITGIEFLD